MLMNNQMLIQNYLVEVKTSIKQFTLDCENYCIPNDCVKGVLELLICVDGIKTKREEALDLIFLQIPELYHCQGAIEFIDNISQLFSGSMNSLFDTDAEMFINMVKNICQDEMRRLDKLKELYENYNGKEDNILDCLDNMNINNI